MNGIYQECFSLIQQYIYGGVELTADMSLTATILATVASIFVFSLPFLIVLWVIKFITGSWL